MVFYSFPIARAHSFHRVDELAIVGFGRQSRILLEQRVELVDGLLPIGPFLLLELLVEFVGQFRQHIVRIEHVPAVVVGHCVCVCVCVTERRTTLSTDSRRPWQTRPTEMRSGQNPQPSPGK